MRIALVCPYSWTHRGGVQGHVRGLARALRRRGCAVDVVAPADRPVAAGAVRRVGGVVEVRDNQSRVPVALSPLAWRRTRRIVAEGGYDVVHVHEPMVPAVALAATLSAPDALVGTFHMYADDPRWYRRFAPLCRRAAARLDVRIAVSRPARDYVAQTLPAAYRIVPNGIGEEAFVERRDADRPRRVLFVGRADPRKGLGVLLEAFAFVPGEVVLDLVGVPAAELARLGCRDPRVRALGPLDDEDRNRLLAESDVLCAPSLAGESFGVVIVEGMAAGIPVVASDLPGYAGVLPSDAGRLLPPGDARALARTLGALLEDAPLRRELGEAGRRAAAAYRWDRVVDDVLECYADALARHGRRRAALVALGRRGGARLPADGRSPASVS